MSKTVVLISGRFSLHETIKVEHESENLHVIWELFNSYKHVNDVNSKLNEEFINRIVDCYSPDYIAIDLPLKVEKVEQLVYAVENTDVILLERMNDKFIQMLIPA
jgi:hypothetical protein